MDIFTNKKTMKKLYLDDIHAVPFLRNGLHSIVLCQNSNKLSQSKFLEVDNGRIQNSFFNHN